MGGYDIMEDDRLELHGVRATPEYVCWMQDGRERDKISRAEVTRITLRLGSQVPRPITQVVLGIVMLGFIIWPGYHLWRFFNYGGVFYGWEAYLSAISLLGAWLVYDACKRGWYFDVLAGTRHNKLPFSRKSTRIEVIGYAARIRDELRYPVESPLPRS